MYLSRNHDPFIQDKQLWTNQGGLYTVKYTVTEDSSTKPAIYPNKWA